MVHTLGHLVQRENKTITGIIQTEDTEDDGGVSLSCKGDYNEGSLLIQMNRREKPDTPMK